MCASPPEGSPDREPVITSRERAGIGLRVYVAVLGLVGIAMGLMFLLVASEVPTWCRWLGYVFGSLFVPGSAYVLFLSMRGRKADLQEFTAKKTADTAATAAAAHIVGEIIDKIS